MAEGIRMLTRRTEPAQQARWPDVRNQAEHLRGDNNIDRFQPKPARASGRPGPQELRGIAEEAEFH